MVCSCRWEQDWEQQKVLDNTVVYSYKCVTRREKRLPAEQQQLHTVAAAVFVWVAGARSCLDGAGSRAGLGTRAAGRFGFPSMMIATLLFFGRPSHGRAKGVAKKVGDETRRDKQRSSYRTALLRCDWCFKASAPTAPLQARCKTLKTLSCSFSLPLLKLAHGHKVCLCGLMVEVQACSCMQIGWGGAPGCMRGALTIIIMPVHDPRRVASQDATHTCASVCPVLVAAARCVQQVEHAQAASKNLHAEVGNVHWC